MYKEYAKLNSIDNQWSIKEKFQVKNQIWEKFPILGQKNHFKKKMLYLNWFKESKNYINILILIQ